ncbi:MAG: hypothetical protein LAT84_01445 [Balneolia bacterium]|nr:hypothetical protein [Balneolia bacterium]
MRLEEIRRELEDLISERGIGSEQLAKIERLQRDVNIALFLAGTATVIGIMAYGIFKLRED